jgi:glycosyltransferase involved in cell wall biosynthesis
MISDQHFIPHGGIGSFCKGFTEMCGRINWKVDILLDKSPNNDEFKTLIESLGGNVLWPLEPLRYTNHVGTFAFSDTINFEKIINFRQIIVEAFEENIYDMIVCNTQEAMTAAYAMTLNKDIPVVFYTHLHSMIFRKAQNFSDVFLDSYHNFYNKHMEFNDIFIGTQTHKNVAELESYGADNCVLLKMPMSERGLLERYTGPRKGVLFIGRWEQGKNPEAYIKVMKECGLPCKVMTNANGAKKFEKAFLDAGITDYEIKAGITGQEKVDFIRSSDTFFMPSLRENYPFAFLECLGHMPCVVLDSQDWSDNFDGQYFHKVNIKNAANLIKTIYGGTQLETALDYVKKLDEEVSQGWIHFLFDFEPRKAKGDKAMINNFNTVCYADYIKTLERKHLAREDFESVLTNRHKFRIIYTDNDTWLTKDPSFEPTEVIVGTSLFQGL